MPGPNRYLLVNPDGVLVAPGIRPYAWFQGRRSVDQGVGDSNVHDGWRAARAQLGDRQVALPLRAVSRIRAQLAHRRQLGMLACLIQLALDG